jgi:hypothetical protein
MNAPVSAFGLAAVGAGVFIFAAAASKMPSQPPNLPGR